MNNQRAGNTQHWKKYERAVTNMFKRLRDAKVEHDVSEMGQTTRELRQIDVRILLQLEVDLGDGFSFDIPVKIIIDCKEHRRPIGVRVVDEVAGLKDDVRAHLALVVTPTGLTEAAERRAKATGVRPIVVTQDLIAVAEGFSIDFGMYLLCHYSSEEEHAPPMVLSRRSVEGRCSWCNGLHVRCPDCQTVFAITESEYDQAVKCPSDCGSVFFLRSGGREDDDLEVFNGLDAALLSSAYLKRGKRLTPSQIVKLVRRTRWQHWGEAAPTIGLTEGGYMLYEDDGNLYLTAKGEHWAAAIAAADYPSLW